MNIIAALTSDYVIGNKNVLPWSRLKGDLPIFKQKTTGATIIMGRATYESMGSRPLPNRENIVVTTTLTEQEGIIIARTLDDAIEKATREVWFIGGERIFAEALPHANKLHLSWVAQDYTGDRYFPRFNSKDWDCTKTELHEEFTLKEYERVLPSR